MEQATDWLGKAWTVIVHNATHMTLTTALWLGLLLLTLILVVLMSTRWGSVKPIWKCVVLSVFAHVLLGGYAYGTKLIFATPEVSVSETVSLKLVDSNSKSSESGRATAGNQNPWDQFELSPELDPAVDVVDRLQPRVDQTISRTQPAMVPRPTRQPRRPSEVLGQLSTNNTPMASVSSVANDDPVASPGSINGNNRSLAEPGAIDIASARQRREEPSTVTAPTSPNHLQAIRIDALQQAAISQTNNRSSPKPLADDRTDRSALLQNLANASADRRQDQQGSLTDSIAQQTQQRASDSLVPRSGAARDSAADEQQGPFRLASAPMRLADGARMPEIYARRNPSSRLENAIAEGGSSRTEQAVQRALQYLASIQSEDGSWNGVAYGAGQERLVLGHDRKGAGTESDTGLTGLALLAFLAAGHSHLEGPYQKNVQLGLEYLISRQASNGEMAGDARLFARMYCHAMATLAITETLAMTGDQRLEGHVRRAVQYSIDAQNKTSGSWRYRPGDDGDMSQFGWQVLVIKSAELAGIDVPRRSKWLMQEFLRSCSTGPGGALASYRPGMEPTIPMTAESLACRFFLQESVPENVTKSASQFLISELPGVGKENLYYWYYGTLAMYQAGGQNWDRWNQHLTRTLLASQIDHGQNAGSWNPTGLWAGYGGRVYSTAMATLCLEIYYRYQPTKRRVTSDLRD